MSEQTIEPPPPRASLLQADPVLKTIKTLRVRISERFPEANLNNVCAELERVCDDSKKRIAWIAQPIWWLRLPGFLFMVLLVVVTIIAASHGLSPTAGDTKMTFAEFVQVTEAGINDLVLIGVAVFFLWTLESRVKRRRALSALHELRSIAHVIDMHQLSKDPDRLIADRPNTKSSPKTTMTAFSLRRYLDYCSEMLSLTSKVAALHLQELDDSAVVAAVNEIEGLTTGLSRKIWQKIDLVGVTEQELSE